MNVRVLGKGLELLKANGGRFEINQLLFADDAALVADSEEKLCRVLVKGLELLSANGGRFVINQLLFADDAALVADSEEKLCRLSLVEYAKEES